MMIGKIFSDPKRTVLIVAALILAAFVCIALLAGLGWTSYRNRATPEPTIEPFIFEYCGERLTELCVVSFGRDAFGDTIINLYVPQRMYPLFYLNIVRSSGESRYECERNKNVQTSIYCTGTPINLGEGFEIQMISEADDRLLARGTFTLTAFLVTTQRAEGEVSETETPDASSIFGVDETETPTATETDDDFSTSTEESIDSGSATPTQTPSSYPYP